MKPPAHGNHDIEGTDVPVQLDRTAAVPWWPILAVATIAAAGAVLTASRLPAPGAQWRELLVGRIAYWYGWAMLAPLVAGLSQRFTVERTRLATSLAAHATALVACSLSHILLVVTAVWIAAGANAAAWTTSVRHAAVQQADMEAITYVALAGLSHAAMYHHRFARSRAHARQLERDLVEARLLTLQRRLQPHFLFNALHAISTLMYRDLQAAEQTMMTLADLLRITLELSAQPEVTLAAELDVVKTYLSIEQVRFADPLSVRFEVEPEALEALVPTLLLQPLVENAVRHGVAKRRGAGRIDIRARRDGRRLALEVQDDGAGLPEDALPALQNGIGVSTTRARLRHLFGADFRFEFHRLPQGLAVVVVLPWRTATDLARGERDEAAEVFDRGRRAAGAGAFGPPAPG